MISWPDAAYPPLYASRVWRMQAPGRSAIKRHGHEHAKSIQKSMSRQMPGSQHSWGQTGNGGDKWDSGRTVLIKISPPNGSEEVKRGRQTKVYNQVCELKLHSSLGESWHQYTRVGDLPQGLHEYVEGCHSTHIDIVQIVRSTSDLKCFIYYLSM